MDPVLRLREFMGGDAPWITAWMRVAALYAAGCLCERLLAEDARRCLDDPDPHVRETAPDVAVIEHDGDGLAMMEAWKDAAVVVVVDAVQSGAAPGTVHRLDARAERLPGRLLHSSSHAFGAAEAIELARALGRLPRQVIIYGIEGRRFAASERLSAPVDRAAADVVVTRIANTGPC